MEDTLLGRTITHTVLPITEMRSLPWFATSITAELGSEVNIFLTHSVHWEMTRHLSVDHTLQAPRILLYVDVFPRSYLETSKKVDGEIKVQLKRHFTISGDDDDDDEVIPSVFLLHHRRREKESFETSPSCFRLHWASRVRRFSQFRQKFVGQQFWIIQQRDISSILYERMH